MELLRKYSEELLGAGLAFLLVGVAVFAWVESRFEALANYQQLASLIPLCFGGLLISANGLATWQESSTIGKWWTVSLGLAFFLIVIGTIGWWLIDPSAHG